MDMKSEKENNSFRDKAVSGYDGLIDRVKLFAVRTSHLESVLIVGSYARGTNRKDSDLDLVFVTRDKAGMVADQSFAEQFGPVARRQTEYYGACTSVRVWYRDGKEVEFGIVEPSWISKPLDEGTRKVLSDGYRVVLDKKQYFKGLKL